SPFAPARLAGLVTRRTACRTAPGRGAVFGAPPIRYPGRSTPSVTESRPDRRRSRADGVRREVAIQDVAARDVLATVRDGGALVQLAMGEDQGHARLRRDVQRVSALVEVGAAARKAVVEVDHEGELALLAVVALETAVGVAGEALADVV